VPGKNIRNDNKPDMEWKGFNSHYLSLTARAVLIIILVTNQALRNMGKVNNMRDGSDYDADEDNCHHADLYEVNI
jgi:hypothetical protein